VDRFVVPDVDHFDLFRDRVSWLHRIPEVPETFRNTVPPCTTMPPTWEPLAAVPS